MTKPQGIKLAIFVAVFVGLQFLMPVIEQKLGINVPSNSVVSQPSGSTLGAGSYVVYATHQIGKDTSDQLSILAYSIDNGTSSLIASEDRPGYADSYPVFTAVGQNIMAYRWFWEKAQDAVIALDGQVTKQQGGSPDGVNTIASADGELKVYWSKTYTNRAASVTMTPVSAATKGEPTVTIDPASLGITLGYAEPFLVSDDGKTVYLRQVFEGETCDQMGLWMLDVATAKITPVSFLTKNNVRSYRINPSTNQLIGTSYTQTPVGDAPGCGDFFGPSKIYLLDLRTGANSVLQSIAATDHAYGQTMLSPDGTMYVFDENDEDVGLRIASVNDPSSTQLIGAKGGILGWVDDDIIFRQFATAETIADYNLKTKKTTTIIGTVDNPSQQPAIEYIGVITTK